MRSEDSLESEDEKMALLSSADSINIEILPVSELRALQVELRSLKELAMQSVYRVPDFAKVLYAACVFILLCIELMGWSDYDNLGSVDLYNHALFNDTQRCAEAFPLTSCSYYKLPSSQPHLQLSTPSSSFKSAPCQASPAIINACCDLFNQACSAIYSSEMLTFGAVAIFDTVVIAFVVSLFIHYYYEPTRYGLRDKVHGFFDRHPELASPTQSCLPTRVTGRGGLFEQVSSALEKVNAKLEANGAEEEKKILAPGM